ncbi:MAG: translation initiation factor IF-2 N-terminal domain-containing protein, partial [Thermodesulfobacteriota bacterium]
MPKKKVNELAQEYQIEAKALLNHLRDLGIFVSSHMSLLDDEEVEKVRATIAYVHKRQEVTEKRVKPTVIRRRVVKAPPPEEAKAPEPTPVEVAAVEEPATHVDQEAAETPEPVTVEVPKPKRPSRAKKEKPSEAAIIIRRPAVGHEAEAASVSPVEAQRAEEVSPPPAQPPASQVPEESESALAEQSAPLPPQPVGEKAEEVSAKPVRGRKAKVVKDFMEPAKIVKRAKPTDVIGRTMPTPEMTPSRVTQLASIVSPEASEEKARPKKRKSLKAFEVITQEKPLRGRVGKKKEVIQLREELEERERGFR